MLGKETSNVTQHTCDSKGEAKDEIRDSSSSESSDSSSGSLSEDSSNEKQDVPKFAPIPRFGGKQIRFPVATESKDSDSESYASIESDEESESNNSSSILPFPRKFQVPGHGYRMSVFLRNHLLDSFLTKKDSDKQKLNEDEFKNYINSLMNGTVERSGDKSDSGWNLPIQTNKELKPEPSQGKGEEFAKLLTSSLKAISTSNNDKKAKKKKKSSSERESLTEAEKSSKKSSKKRKKSSSKEKVSPPSTVPTSLPPTSNLPPTCSISTPSKSHQAEREKKDGFQPSKGIVSAKKILAVDSLEQQTKPALSNRIAVPMPTVSAAAPKDYKTMDPVKLKKTSEVLFEEARKMKHLGDKVPKTEATKRADYYLRSSIHFFEYSLILEDLKYIWRSNGGLAKSKYFGDTAVRILPQTGSLVEVAARAYESDGRKDRAAMRATSYKFAAVVYMYIFRCVRLKLEAVYNELYQTFKSATVLGAFGGVSSNPVSPLDASTAVPSSTTSSPVPYTCSPPPNPVADLTNSGNNSSSNSAMNGSKPSGVSQESYAYFLKEIGFLFRGFELWFRSQRLDNKVLPQMTDLSTVNVEMALKWISQELDK